MNTDKKSFARRCLLLVLGTFFLREAHNNKMLGEKILRHAVFNRQKKRTLFRNY
jgi:hypothetical protein